MKVRQEVRFSTDLCTCGHPWSDHYQPRALGRAACWAREHGLLDECHNFVMAPDQ